MPIAPRRPHKSWYRHFWYAQRSPGDTLVDRALIFAIVTLTLLAGGMLLVRHGATPRATDPLPAADVALDASESRREGRCDGSDAAWPTRGGNPALRSATDHGRDKCYR